jgi:hypothetical protein
VCWAAAWLASVAGCGRDYDHVALDLRAGGPLPVQMSDKGMSISVGAAVAFEATALDARGEPFEREDAETLTLRSTSPAVIEVMPGPSPRTFVAWGVTVGRAEVIVGFRSRTVASIPAEVVAQR